MGGPCHGGGGGLKRKRNFEARWRRTKRRYANHAKDVDQIQDEVIAIKEGRRRPEPLDSDKPGMGKFKCVICSRYFVTESVLNSHKKTKKHKKMLKKVGRPQYTQKEADKCGGLGREIIKRAAVRAKERRKPLMHRTGDTQMISIDQ